MFQQTNNSWNTLNYTALEITATKNLSHGFQFMAGINRQWQHMDGDWNPTDPARFIQPGAFANDKLLVHAAREQRGEQPADHDRHDRSHLRSDVAELPG